MATNRFSLTCALNQTVSVNDWLNMDLIRKLSLGFQHPKNATGGRHVVAVNFWHRRKWFCRV